MKRQIVAFDIQKYPDQGILLIKKMLLLTNSNQTVSNNYHLNYKQFK